MMPPLRWLLATKQCGELQLTTRTVQQVLPANHDVDVVCHVIDGDRELIGPLPVSIAHEQVAALLGGRLLHVAESPILERLDAVGDVHATRERFALGMTGATTGAWVARLLTRYVWCEARDVASRAGAHIGEVASTQGGERGGVAVFVIRLSLWMRVWRAVSRRAKAVRTADVRHEAEPVEVVEQRVLVVSAASRAIVVLDPQQDVAAERPRDAPHMDRVDDVAEVQIPGRCRREAGAPSHRLLPAGDVGVVALAAGLTVGAVCEQIVAGRIHLAGRDV